MFGRMGGHLSLNWIIVGLSACLLAPLQASFVSNFRQEKAPPSNQAPKSVDLGASPSGREFSQAFQLFVSGDLDEARQHYNRALELAQEEKNTYVEASSRMGLGLILSRKARYPEARSELEQAVALFKALSNRLYTGRACVELGTVAWHMGDIKQADSLYREALAEFEAIGDLREKANILYNLIFTAPTWEQEEERIRQGLAAAEQVNDRRLQGQLFHVWGDLDYKQGDFSASLEKLEKALALLDATGAKDKVARVYTSLGRSHRVHGSPEQALEFYRRALKIQEETGDQQGMIQSINSTAIACDELGKRQEAMEHFERALTLARQTGSPELIGRQLSNLGMAHSKRGNYARAIELFQQSLQHDGQKEYTYAGLSLSQFRTGDYARAFETAQKAVELSENGIREFLPTAFLRRAQAREKLGQLAEALDDARAALREIEQMRGHLVPDDFMKLGFGERKEYFFAYAIQLLHQSGRHVEALEVAEQARARAFVDLMATREVELDPSFRAELTVARKLEDDLRSKGINPSEGSWTPSYNLTLRGGDSEAASLWKKWQGVDPGLRSLVSAPPIAANDIRAAAARHDSTILSYWVSPEVTFIWVLTPDGSLHAARADVSGEYLSRLVRETCAGAHSPVERSAQLAEESENVNPADETIAKWEPRLRGEDLLVLSGMQKKAWHELYQILIRPVRTWLPAKPGSRLTIVPHGPLFLLSFAALVDENDRYLVEKYTLNYTPSAAALQLAEKKKSRLTGRSPRYLLVADPSGLPSLPGGKPLPSLPGSRREVTAIARLLPPGSVTMLVGAEAQEATVRSLISDKTIIHVATHGVVRNDLPLDSFLALGRQASAGSPAATSSQDGRLTAQEIYGLHLDAELVVLSACRTASGKVSGDGIIGLTRAFFYAGTPSVIATLWDVADEPTNWLFPSFYRHLQRSQDKGKALRAAQLQLLDALRRKQVKITTPAGAFVLPEHPVFWASFILLGEP